MNMRRICVIVMACFVLMVSGCNKESGIAEKVKIDEVESASYELSASKSLLEESEILINEDMSENKEKENISYLELTKQHLNMTVEEIEKKYNEEIDMFNGSMSLVYGSPAIFPVIDICEYEMFVLCIGEDVSMKPCYITYTEEKMKMLYEELNISSDFDDKQLQQSFLENGFEITDKYQDNDQYVFIYKSDDLAITIVSFNEDATEFDMYFSK